MKRRTFISLPALSAAASEGWSWERWREISGESRPVVSSDQTGRPDLSDLLQREGRKITSPAEWPAQRSAIARLVEVFLYVHLSN